MFLNLNITFPSAVKCHCVFIFCLPFQTGDEKYNILVRKPVGLKHRRDNNTKSNIKINMMPVSVASRSEVKALIAWTLRPWVRIPLRAGMFFFVFLCCVVEVEALRRGSPPSRKSYQMSEIIKKFQKVILNLSGSKRPNPCYRTRRIRYKVQFFRFSLACKTAWKIHDAIQWSTIHMMQGVHMIHLTLDIVHRRGLLNSFPSSLATLSPRKAPWRLGLPQSQYGHYGWEKNVLSAGNQSPFVQHKHSHCTDLAITAPDIAIKMFLINLVHLKRPTFMSLIY
jgi:hypothetical protein